MNMKSSGSSIAPQCKADVQFDATARKLGLIRHAGEDSDGLASRCHYRIDHLMREHALQVGARRIIELMDLHDAIERLIP